MTPPATRPRFVRASHAAAGILLAAALVATPILAGGNATTQHFKPAGSGDATANGDFISSTGGLNTAYHYFIEVPPGSSRLVVDMWDADVNSGGATELAADRDSNDSTTTSARVHAAESIGGRGADQYPSAPIPTSRRCRQRMAHALRLELPRRPIHRLRAPQQSERHGHQHQPAACRAGSTAGDMLVAVVARGRGRTPAIATPTGWTYSVTRVDSGGTTDQHVRLGSLLSDGRRNARRRR